MARLIDHTAFVYNGIVMHNAKHKLVVLRMRKKKLNCMMYYPAECKHDSFICEHRRSFKVTLLLKG